MNKSIILFFAAVFELAGNFIPTLFGDKDFFSVWSIVGGIVGGLFGIWVGVVVSNQLD